VPKDAIAPRIGHELERRAGQDEAFSQRTHAGSDVYVWRPVVTSA
jgi:hypothetical protein